MRLIRKIISTALLISLIALVGSCSRSAESADSMLRKFAGEYGIGGVIYSPLVCEGDAGYITPRFFEELYGRGSDGISDYAVLLHSNTNAVYEAAIFICKSAYDAERTVEMLHERIRLISSAAPSLGGAGNAGDCAVVIKSHNTVAMCLMPDNVRAKRIMRNILP